MASFGKAFAAARKAKGPGKTFMWQGKSYSTNTASDSGKGSAPTSSPRPPSAGAKGAARGRQGAAAGAAGAARGAAGAAAGAAAAARVRERMPQVEASTEGRRMERVGIERPFMPETRAALASAGKTMRARAKAARAERAAEADKPPAKRSGRNNARRGSY